MSEFPMEAIAEKVQNNRKIGLGVMGFHDMLVDLGLPYHSEEAVTFAGELMAFINETAWEMSKYLAAERGFYSDDLLDQIRERTSIQDFEEIPADIKELFPTAHDIVASHHMRMQAAFQEHVDNAVSKTVNLPADAADEDIKRIVLEARDWLQGDHRVPEWCETRPGAWHGTAQRKVSR